MRVRGVLVLFLIVLLVLTISTAETNSNIKVEDQVIEKLNDQDQVSVIVFLKDEPIKEDRRIRAINIERINHEQRKQLAEQRKQQIKQTQDSVLIDLEKTKQKRRFLGIQIAKKEADYKLKHKYSNINAISIKGDKETIEKLKDNPDVKKIVLNKQVHIAMQESNSIIKSDQVWPLQTNLINLTGSTKTVCVIDTGTNYSHASLADAYLGGYDFADDDDDPMDDNGHGTHCAAIVASRNSTYPGVAPGANIVALRALKDLDGIPGGSASGSEADVVAAIDWCIDNSSKYNISVISMSLSDSVEYTSANCPSTYNEIIAAATAQNIMVVAATGNEAYSSGTSAPACTPNVTGVGATYDANHGSLGFSSCTDSTTALDKLTCFTNLGDTADLLAPGSRIMAADIATGYVNKDGTSMSTPMVAGAVTLIQQYYDLLFNQNATPQQIETILNTTGKNITRGAHTLTRINILNAIISIDNQTPTYTINSPTTINQTTNYNYLTINLSFNEKINYTFEWNTTNESSANSSSFSTSKTALSKGNYSYKIYLKDIANNTNISSAWIYINNSEPNITSYTPANQNPSVAENSSILFNHTSNDIEQPSLNYQWLLNNSQQSTNQSWLYQPDFDAAGFYNITLIVIDNFLNTSTSWSLTVNNTNRAPIINSTNTTQTINESDILYLSFNASDADSDSLTYYIHKDNTLVSSNNTYNWTTNYSDSGTYTFIFFANDSNNASINYSFNLTILNVNQAPILQNISNITINESDNLTITLNASDFDQDNLTYFINNTEFTQNNNTFTWQTTILNSGEYYFNVTASDGSLNSSILVYALIIDTEDTDNDGINNTQDNLIGNINSIQTLVTNLTIYINSSDNVTKSFNQIEYVQLKRNNITLIEFSFNFSNKLNLSNITFDTQTTNTTANYVLVKNLNLQSGTTKNFTLTKYVFTTNALCIKDAEIDSINNISSACDQSGETRLSCPGTSGQYTCTFNNSVYKVTGLTHSGAKEICVESWSCNSWTACSGSSQSRTCTDANSCGTTYDKPSVTQSCTVTTNNGNTGGGGGGGGGGIASATTTSTCTEKWNCTNWSKDNCGTRTCTDQNNCDTTKNKPLETQTCKQDSEQKNINTSSQLNQEEEQDQSMAMVTAQPIVDILTSPIKKKFGIAIIIGIFVITVLSLIIFEYEKRHKK